MKSDHFHKLKFFFIKMKFILFNCNRFHWIYALKNVQIPEEKTISSYENGKKCRKMVCNFIWLSVFVYYFSTQTTGQKYLNWVAIDRIRRKMIITVPSSGQIFNIISVKISKFSHSSELKLLFFTGNFEQCFRFRDDKEILNEKNMKILKESTEFQSKRELNILKK